MRIVDLAILPYRDAWAMQEKAQQEVLAGGEERIFLLEHPPVITLGRRPEVARNLLVSARQLEELKVELVQSDRGGDITFHGPGQLIAYPIIRLLDHRFSIGCYVRKLEETVIGLLGEEYGLLAQRDTKAVGVWVPAKNGELAKIAAIGVRIRRSVSMHGLALNVNTDLHYFKLIVPCGLAKRPVTSLWQILGASAPPLQKVKEQLGRRLLQTLGAKAATCR